MEKILHAVNARKEGGFWIRKLKIKITNQEEEYYIPCDNSKDYGWEKIRFRDLNSFRSSVFTTLEKALSYMNDICLKKLS